MIQETKSNRMSRLAMSQEEVTDWIVNKRVLSIALEGQLASPNSTFVDFNWFNLFFSF